MLVKRMTAARVRLAIRSRSISQVGKGIRTTKIKPAQARGNIKPRWRCNRPIRGLEKDVAVKFIKKLAERGSILVFTPWAVKAFQEQNINFDEMMGLVEVTDRLVKGGQIGNITKELEHVFFFGGNYYHQSQMLSSVKNFATHLTTISLTRYRQPNASYSFPNLKEQRWITVMESVIEAI